MATIRWYLSGAATVEGWSPLETTPQAANNVGNGWTVGTGATFSSEFVSPLSGPARPTTSFVSNTVPDGTLDTTLHDAFFTGPLNGTFASGDWTFQFAVLSVTNPGAADGQIVFRLIKANADGSGATEITSGQQTCSVVTNVLGTGTTFNSTLTFNPGAFTITDQHLFVQVAWKRTGAGGMTTTNIMLRTGSSATVGTTILSSDFTPGIQSQAVALQHVYPTSRLLYTNTLLLDNPSNGGGTTAANGPGRGPSQTISGHTGLLTAVSLELSLTLDTPPDGMYLVIRESTFNGTILDTSLVVPGTVLTSTRAWVQFTLRSGVLLNAGTTYWIEVYLTRLAVDGSNFWTIFATTNGVYTGGEAKDQGGFPIAGFDLGFRLYTGTSHAVTGGGSGNQAVGGVFIASTAVAQVVTVAFNVTLPPISSHIHVEYYDQAKIGTRYVDQLGSSDNFVSQDPTTIFGQSFHASARFSVIQTLINSQGAADGTLVLEIHVGNQLGPIVATVTKPVSETTPGVNTFRLHRFDFPTIDPGGISTLYTWTLRRTDATAPAGNTNLLFAYNMAPAGNPSYTFYEGDSWIEYPDWHYFTRVLSESVFAPIVALAAAPSDQVVLLATITGEGGEVLLEDSFKVLLEDGSSNLLLESRAGLSQVFAPSVSVVSAPDQAVTTAHRPTTVQLSAVTVAPGQVLVNGPTRPSTLQMFAPAVVPGPVTVVGATIGGAAPSTPTLRHAVSAQATATVATVTATGIVPAGTNRYGLVKVNYFGNPTIVSVVWGGVNITANVIKSAAHDGSARKRLAWFYYLNPPESSANVVLTLSASTFDLGVIVEAWDNVHQGVPYGSLTFTADNTTQTSYPPSLTVVSAADEVVTDSYYNFSAPSALQITVGAGQTSIQELEGASTNGYAHGSSYAPGAASVLMDWTNALSTGGAWAMYALALKPASVAAGSACFAPTVGVGAVAVLAATVPLASQVFAASVGVGPATVLATTLATTAQVFALTIGVGSVAITGATRASTSVVTAPAVALTTTGATIGSTNGIFPPQMVALTVTTAAQPTTTVVFAPTIGLPLALVTTGTVGSTEQRFAPTVAPGAATVSGATCPNTGQVFDPAIAVGSIAIAVAFQPTTIQVFAPIVAVGDIAVSVPTLATTAQAFVLTVAPGPVTVIGGTVSTGVLSQVFTTPGTTQWLWPVGVTTVFCEAIGGGGGGGAATGAPSTGGGGMGGGYASVTITKGVETQLAVLVGAGGPQTANGVASTVMQGAALLLRASGGGTGLNGNSNNQNGFGGTVRQNTPAGTVIFAGGQGGTGDWTSGVGGSGAGGGAAGPSGAGGNGTGHLAGIANTGAFANGLSYGGNGGVGAIDGQSGRAGLVYGGGASGGKANTTTDRVGGTGALGIVVLTWSDSGSQPNQLFAPSLTVGAATVLLSAWDVSTEMFSPSVTAVPAGGLSTSHVPSTRVMYPLTVSTGPVSVVGAHLLTSGSLFEPSVASTVSVAFIASVGITRAPVVAPGVVTVGGATIASTGVRFAPSVAPGSTTLLGVSIAAVSQCFAPSIATGPITVGGVTISAGSQCFAPALGVGITVVGGATIARTLQVFAPTLVGVLNGSFIASTATVFPPLVRPTLLVTTAFLAGSGVRFAPSVAVRITTAFASGVAQVFAPSLATVTPVTTGTVLVETRVFAPSLIGDLQVTTAPIGSTVQLIAPTVEAGLVGEVIGTTAQVFAPVVYPTLVVGFISTTASLFEPYIAPVIEDIRVGGLTSTTVVFPPLLKRVFAPGTCLVSQINVRYLVTNATMSAMTQVEAHGVSVRLLTPPSPPSSSITVVSEIQTRTLVTSAGVHTCCAEKVS